MAASRALQAAAWLVMASVPVWPAAARAQSTAVYTVRRVSVDETGASAAAARDVALAKGQAAAFQTLIERLVLASDQPHVARPGSAQLASMILGFEVENEKTSRVRYLADLTVRFSPAAVRTYLRSAGVRFAETRSKPILVLPVYREVAGLKLWEKDNPWRQVWAEIGGDAGLVPVIVPPGDDKDQAMLAPDQALGGDQVRLAALARRYGAADVLLVAATLDGATEQPSALEVTISRFGAGGADTTTVRSFNATPDMTIDTLLKTAARQIVNETEEAWKRENLLRFDERRQMTVHATLSGLPDWVRLRKRLDGAAAIQETTLLSLSLDRATFLLSYLGNEQQLVTALAQRDLELTRGAIDWEIRMRAGQRNASQPSAAQKPGPAAPAPAESSPAR